VEYDPYGRRVQYWMFPVHPGEIGALGLLARSNRFQSQPVPADLVDHIYRIDRPGQVRGVPWLAPIPMTLRDISDYEEAELVRKKIAACLAFFIKSPSGSTASVAKVVRERDAEGKPERIESVKPGRIHYLDPDQEVTSVDPSPSIGYADYLTAQLRKAAAGVHMPYEQLSGDVTQVNFSSLREVKLDFWDILDGWQWNMLIPQHCRPAWRRVMKFGMLAGLKVSPDIRALHSPPTRPWVDPEKDVDAKLKSMAAGLEVWPEVVAQLTGMDPEDQIEIIQTWKPLLEGAGIRFDASSKLTLSQGRGEGNAPAANA